MQRIPFIGARQLERLAHGHFPHRRRMAAGRGQVGEHPFADPDHVLDQEPGQNRQLLAHPFGLPEVNLGRLAAAHDVEQAGAADEPRQRGDFLALGLAVFLSEEEFVSRAGEMRVYIPYDEARALIDRFRPRGRLGSSNYYESGLGMTGVGWGGGSP
jgi:hypothetical protein